MRRGLASRLPLALRFALRDLSGDLRGFGVFIACIVIGVAAISGVGAVSRSLADGLAREGRVILGGDVSVATTMRRLSPQEREFFERYGRVCEIALMRAMARSASGEAALVEIKAVEFGLSERRRGGARAAAGAGRGAAPARGRLRPRRRFDADRPSRSEDRRSREDRRGLLRLSPPSLSSEPDKLAGGFGFGARVVMSQEALQATGLVQPGAVLRWLTRISLAGAGAIASDAEVERFATALSAAFPDAGWDLRKRDAVSPQFSRNQERFTQLLTLVALTALVAGGAGVANAVAGFVARKRDAFAILKALGAPASRVFAMALVEVLLVAGLAVVGGLALGATFPYLADFALSASIPLPFSPSVDARSLGVGAAYGLLVALIFALPPLGRAYGTPVARLLRDEAEERAPPRVFLLAALAAAALLVALVMATAADKKLAATYIVATAAAFALLRGVAALVVRAARRVSHVPSARLRHAIGNIRRPKSLAATLIVSIGVTQTLLVALALIEGSIHAELFQAQKSRTPSFYFVDVAKEQVGEFVTFLASFAADARIEHVPMMRGRIVAVKGVRSENLKAPEEIAWALEGDRGVTFSAAPPKGSEIVAGSWWGAERGGSPLVSLEARVAEGLGIGIGDEITVNVLGRDVAARVANLRRVDWRSYGINFMMVFSPDAFADAPYSEIFTAAFADRDDPSRDKRLVREVAARFPQIAALRVKDALEAVEKIADQLTFAARGGRWPRHRHGGAGARQRRGGEPARAPARRHRAEDARRDARLADQRLRARIRAARPRGRSFLGRGGRRRGGLHPGGADENGVRLPALAGRADDARRARLRRRPRPRGQLARARREARPGAAPPIGDKKGRTATFSAVGSGFFVARPCRERAVALKGGLRRRSGGWTRDDRARPRTSVEPMPQLLPERKKLPVPDNGDFSLPQIFASIGGGLAGAAVFAVLTKGTSASVLFAFLAPLPILIVALGFGLRHGATSALIATGLLSIWPNPIFGVVYACSRRDSSPRRRLCRGRGALARTRAGDVPCAGLGGSRRRRRGGDGGLRRRHDRGDSFRRPRRGAQSAARPRLSWRSRIWCATQELGDKLDPSQLSALVVFAFPATLAALTLFSHALNLWGAGLLARASDALSRPWPDIAQDFVLPRTVAGLFLVASAVAFLGDLPGEIGLVFAETLGLALAMQGLAVVHALLRGTRVGGVTLTVIYIVIGLFAWPIVLFTVIGVVDAVFSFRSRKRAAQARRG